ncbi:hypothetical protein [Glaciibacter superstes]|uniref:hypothetical protein n=1 Tax=Glaciibacter superstes TaxID=501023 RepID=UPI0003B6570B|nr:hypothetical protein [Glaciibacter superstes]
MTALTAFLLAATPPPADTVTPGPIGFLAIFLVAVVTVLLGIDMVRRIRRTTYREQIKERLDAELAERNAAEDTHNDQKPE